MSLADYFQQTADCWRSHAGRDLGPLDFAYLTAWQEAGIPLTAVILGIQRTFAGFHPRPGNERIRSLRYCKAEIYTAAHELWPEEFWERSRAS
jgi:hypothetical protein